MRVSFGRVSILSFRARVPKLTCFCSFPSLRSFVFSWIQAKYQNNWTQPPSASQTKSQREDLRSQRTSLQSASQSDSRVLSLYHSIGPSLDVLRTTDNLGKAFAEAVAGSEGASSSKAVNLLDLDVASEERGEKDLEEVKTLVGDIEERLGRLSRLKRERETSLKDLKELVSLRDAFPSVAFLCSRSLADRLLSLLCKIQTDDVSQQLLLNRRSGSVDTLFATELEKFRPFQNRLQTAIDHEKSTLQELTDLLERLTEQKGAKETQAKWEGAERRIKELNGRLGKAIVDYQEVKTSLR